MFDLCGFSHELHVCFVCLRLEDVCLSAEELASLCGVVFWSPRSRRDFFLSRSSSCWVSWVRLLSSWGAHFCVIANKSKYFLTNAMWFEAFANSLTNFLKSQWMVCCPIWGRSSTTSSHILLLGRNYLTSYVSEKDQWNVSFHVLITAEQSR